MGLNILEYSGHNLTICKKNVCLSVCNIFFIFFCASVIQEQMYRISGNCIFSYSIHIYGFLQKCYNRFWSFCDRKISDSITWNHIQFLMQDTYNKRCHWYKLCGHSSIWETVLLLLLSSKRKSCFGEHSWLPVSNTLHNIGCPEHNETSAWKNMFVYIYEKILQKM